MAPPDSFELADVAARLASSLAPTLSSPEPVTSDAAVGAAVAAILRAGREPGSGAEVLFIRRADRDGDPWSGHMAFPGGRRSASDVDLVATAVRETMEEVGLDLRAHARLIGRLPDCPAYPRTRRTGLVVAPFVFALVPDARFDLTFDAREVAEAIWAPLRPLAHGELADTMHYDREGVTVDFPSWNVEGRVVWGLTYRMLETLFEALAT